MSAFSDALRQDAEREFFSTGGDLVDDAVRIKLDGTNVEDLSVVTEFAGERIDNANDGEFKVTTLKVVASPDQKPDVEEVWIIEGLRYSVTAIEDVTDQWAQFTAEHWAPLRKQRSGTTAR